LGFSALTQKEKDQVENAPPADKQLDTIVFAPGLPTMFPTGQLPVVTDSLVIDGTVSQPGYKIDHPVIELNGSQAGFASGLVFVSDGNTVRGLIINSFLFQGIDVAGFRLSLGGNTIQGNFIGTDATGMSAMGNRNGVLMDESPNNHIGGLEPGQRNLISGNL